MSKVNGIQQLARGVLHSVMWKLLWISWLDKELPYHFFKVTKTRGKKVTWGYYNLCTRSGFAMNNLLGPQIWAWGWVWGRKEAPSDTVSPRVAGGQFFVVGAAWVNQPVASGQGEQRHLVLCMHSYVVRMGPKLWRGEVGNEHSHESITRIASSVWKELMSLKPFNQWLELKTIQTTGSCTV